MNTHKHIHSVAQSSWDLISGMNNYYMAILWINLPNCWVWASQGKRHFLICSVCDPPTVILPKRAWCLKEHDPGMCWVHRLLLFLSPALGWFVCVLRVWGVFCSFVMFSSGWEMWPFLTLQKVRNVCYKLVEDQACVTEKCYLLNEIEQSRHFWTR